MAAAACRLATERSTPSRVASGLTRCSPALARAPSSAAIDAGSVEGPRVAVAARASRTRSRSAAVSASAVDASITATPLLVAKDNDMPEASGDAGIGQTAQQLGEPLQ